jgi:hypothetical protein
MAEFMKFIGGPQDGETKPSEMGLPCSNIRMPDPNVDVKNNLILNETGNPTFLKGTYSVYVYATTEYTDNGDAYHVLNHHSDVKTQGEANRIANEWRNRQEYRKAWEEWALRRSNPSNN